MNNKVKSTIIALASLVAGYVAGSIFGLPQVSKDMGSGDISKVSKYYKGTATPMSSAYQEKLLNDAEALQEACISMEILTNRMYDFSNLVNKSIELTEGKEEFKGNIEALRTVKTLSDNAVETGKVAYVSFQDLIAGEKNNLTADYEQVAQNLAVAYLMVDRQVELGKQFVASADLYLRKKSVEENAELALLRDLWAEYCAGSAYLNNDKDELAYWDKKECLLSSDQVSKVVNNQAQKTAGVLIQKEYQTMVQEHIENMAQKTILNVAQKTVENQAQKAVENAAQKTVENVAQKTIENQAQKVIENQAQKAVENAAQKTIENQAQKTVENVAQKTVENQAQKVIENAAQKTVSTVVMKTLENMAQKTLENQVQKAMENQAQMVLRNK